MAILYRTPLYSAYYCTLYTTVHCILLYTVYYCTPLLHYAAIRYYYYYCYYYFMDDIKLYAKNEQDIDSWIHLIRVFSSNIGMKFGLVKCRHLIVNRGKMKSTSGISLQEGQVDDIDESYKYLGTLQSFSNNDEEERCKATSEYRNLVRRDLRGKFSSNNKVTAINTFAVPFIRYPATVVS